MKSSQRGLAQRHWDMPVPKQSEIAGQVPYEHSMSAEELLQELLHAWLVMK